MSKHNRVIRCKNLYQGLLQQHPEEFLEWTDEFADYDGLDKKETDAELKYVLDSLAIIDTEGLWDVMSWHALSSFEGSMNSLVATWAQLRGSRDQGSFQAFAQNVDAFAYHIRALGTDVLTGGGARVQQNATLLSEEIERVARTQNELDKMRAEVKALITPAVAGSLSQAFDQRKRTLMIGRIAWGVVAIVAAVFCISATFDFASVVGQAMAAIQTGVKTQTAGVPAASLGWTMVVVRSVILIPLYAAFGFSFSQYKKERDFEEEYAHKAAVATSLPNYGDLTREPAVRDQIVTGATAVIFSSPVNKRSEPERSEKVLTGVRDIIDSLGKVIPGKEELRSVMRPPCRGDGLQQGQRRLP